MPFTQELGPLHSIKPHDLKATPSVHFLLAILEMGGGEGVSQTICSSWPWISIFLISASQIARREPLVPGDE
jgi:hypothetical protein